ncbi:hypothetical protein J5N97_025371 [Dioscorea zingiberensis]|uniref:Uncharacterized protein n=1 Tax=Dioscorea zingiberensis TaxID=325984 RepID=A0A9D5C8K9_9LILI|nr:hypothetical protein J5N97_025371 [Dioscorea zingiberensis]
MGQCQGKNISVAGEGSPDGDPRRTPQPPPSSRATPAHPNAWPSPFPQGTASPLPAGVSPSPARSTPRRFFRWPLPPPSPAKHIKASLAKRQGKPTEVPIPEDGGGGGGGAEGEAALDKSFGYGRNFGAKYELVREVGRGHFGHTCSARVKKGELKGQLVAVKIIPKAKVRWALFIVDLKPENFLFSTKDENSSMKIIDFGLSDFVRPDERLNDIVGSAYYVAPEVLHRAYSMEADIWSVGVITYILLCGSRPFWARTESGIFRSVLRADPNFDDSPWPSVSPEAKDFVRRLLNKDYRKRMTAVQALTHPWLRDEQRHIPLDILIYKLVKSYLRASPLKRAALKALSKALTEDALLYLRSQFKLLEPNRDGRVSLENFRMALMQNATDAMKESRVPDILNSLEPLYYRKLDFEEFCVSSHQPLSARGFGRVGRHRKHSF